VGPQRAAVGAHAAPHEDDEFSAGSDLPPGDAHAIAAKCRQLGQARLVSCNGIAEPYWRAVLSVLIRCDDGDTLIHEWSKGDPRYDADETRLKAAGTRGPATCAHFAEVNPGGCDNCPFAGKVSSPILIRPKLEPVTTPDSGEDAGTPIVPAGFTIGRSGLFMEQKDEAPLKVADIPIWMEQVNIGATTTTRSSVRMAWNDTFGRYFSRVVEQRDLSEPRTLNQWLADNNLRAFVHEMGAFMHYISRLTAEHYRQKGAAEVFDAMGWYDNYTRFVLGPRAITAEGEEPVVISNSTTIADLEPKGDVSEWSAAMQLLNRPQFSYHAFTVLAALGSPLLEMAGRDGCVIALVGESGNSKTLAAKLGLSAFFSPERVMESGSSTLNAVEIRSGAHRHAPVLIDEVTTVPTKRLMEMIYMAANGKGKATLTRNRTMRRVETWKLTTFFTSNHSLVDRPQAEVEEAHRRRLLELPVTKPLPKAVSRQLYRAMEHNYGVAAPVFLRECMKHAEQMPAIFDLVEQWVEKQSQAGDKNRFVTWAMTAALLAGILARQAGLLSWNPLHIIRDVIHGTAGDYQSIQSSAERAHDSLMEWLTENSQYICRWEHRGFGEPVDAAVARISDGVLYVKTKALVGLWAAEHINQRSIDHWLGSVLHSPDPIKMRLSPTAPGAILCYAFSMRKLGLTAEQIMPMEAAQPKAEE
jgi:hypothetical protein